MNKLYSRPTVDLIPGFASETKSNSVANAFKTSTANWTTDGDCALLPTCEVVVVVFVFQVTSVHECNGKGMGDKYCRQNCRPFTASAHIMDTQAKTYICICCGSCKERQVVLWHTGQRSRCFVLLTAILSFHKHS